MVQAIQQKLLNLCQIRHFQYQALHLLTLVSFIHTCNSHVKKMENSMFIFIQTTKYFLEETAL